MAQNLEIALSVPISPPYPTAMTRATYLGLLAAKLQALVDESPATAQMALQMSQESYPDLYAIPGLLQPSEWGVAILRTRPLVRELRRLAEWGTVLEAEHRPLTLLQILDAM